MESDEELPELEDASSLTDSDFAPYANIFNTTTFSEIIERDFNNEINHYFCECINYGYTNLADIKYMVERGANPNFDNDRPFLTACRSSKLEIVQYLVLECGADINTKEGKGLINAIKQSQYDIVEYLFQTDIIITDKIIETLIIQYNEKYLSLVFQQGFNMDRFAQIFWKHNDMSNEDASYVNTIIHFLVREGLDINQSIQQYYRKDN